MQAAAERRTAMDPRVPFEASISLANHGCESPLSADGVNLSRRGLKIRSTQLPEIGTWLECRFLVDPDKPAVFAEGEVVWTSQRDGGAGEFGVRFAEVDPEVERWVRNLAKNSDSTDFDQEHSEVRDVQPEQDARCLADYSMSTELYLDELRTPILTRSAHEAHDLVILEQDLPFLRINTGVCVVQDENKALQRGRLASVDLQMVDDMPRLTLSVVYENRTSGIEKVTPLRTRTAAVPASSVAIDDENVEIQTLRDSPSVEDLYQLTSGVEARDLASVEPEAYAQPFDEMPTPVRLTSPEQLSGLHKRDEDQECRAFQVHSRTNEDDAIPDAFGEPQGPESALFREEKNLLATVHTALARACVQVVARLTPSPKRLVTSRPVRLAARPLANYTATLSQTARICNEMLRLMMSKVGIAWPARRIAKRRTAPAPRRQVGTNMRVTPMIRIPKNWWLLGAALIGLIGLILLWRGQSDSSEPNEVGMPGAAVPAQRLHNGTAAEPDYGTEPSQPVAHPPTASLSEPAAQGVDPLLETALPAPSYEAGPVAPTRYPSVTDAPSMPGARRVQGLNAVAPSRTPIVSQKAPVVASPSPVVSAAGAQIFGTAKLTKGTRLTLRMSRPVAELRGTRAVDGFRVVVPGALSLDKAGPLAAAHSSVARAAIFNHGDRSELSVFFVPGKSPAYRVQAKGASIEILIAD